MIYGYAINKLGLYCIYESIIMFSFPADAESNKAPKMAILITAKENNKCLGKSSQ